MQSKHDCLFHSFFNDSLFVCIELQDHPPKCLTGVMLQKKPLASANEEIVDTNLSICNCYSHHSTDILFAFIGGKSCWKYHGHELLSSALLPSGGQLPKRSKRGIGSLQPWPSSIFSFSIKLCNTVAVSQLQEIINFYKPRGYDFSWKNIKSLAKFINFVLIKVV